MRAPLAAAAIDETAATIASETAFILPAGFDAQRNACGRRRRASIRNTRGEIEKKVGEALFLRREGHARWAIRGEELILGRDRAAMPHHVEGREARPSANLIGRFIKRGVEGELLDRRGGGIHRKKIG